MGYGPLPPLTPNSSPFDKYETESKLDTAQNGQ